MICIKAIDIINEVNENGIRALEKYNKSEYYYPLSMIFKSKEKRANIESLKNKSDADSYTKKYIFKTFEILEELNISDKEVYKILETTLLWCDISKLGTKTEIKKWKKEGHNLDIHNIGSASIYGQYSIDKVNRKEIIKLLIETHGLVGQYIRGETKIKESSKVIRLVEDKLLDKKTLKEILRYLNECVVKAVSEDLWEKLSFEIFKIVDDIIAGKTEELTFQTRFKALRANRDKDISLVTNSSYKKHFSKLFDNTDLWYVEAALSAFSLEEYIKVFALIFINIDVTLYKNLSFEKLMDDIYYDRKGEKKVNLYKKRIIEKYLAGIDLENNIFPVNDHVKVLLIKKDTSLMFDFKFSKAAEKLIEFCEVAETTDSPIYERSIIMLYDMFEFRKDKYDWFFNENDYLKVMNKTITFKSVILDYIVGNVVVDVGPGGGALMDMIEERYPNKKIIGVDIAKNVVEELNKIKEKNNRKWEVMEMDILNVSKKMEKDSIDSIIFSSVIHELFSYIEMDGKKFNYKTISEVLKNAYYILKPGGRIIIRDGIKTEGNAKRIIEFKEKEGIEFFNNYIKDFKGREIKHEFIEPQKVILDVNDAMEFLYTYTWGIESYPREIQEQFGYFTPNEFIKFVKDNLDGAIVVELKHYLQDGYEEHLLKKINLFDELGSVVSLPDSTCLIVIEKALNN